MWCGSNGNVIRSIDKDEQDRFSNYVFNNKEKILDGTFDLRNVDSFSNKTPRSWVSKICHILNPQMYPIIYDAYVCSNLKLKTINQFWDELIIRREDSINKTREEIYREEAVIWAPDK